MGITYSNAHLLRLEAASRFPVRVRLSPGRVAWIKAEIMSFIADRAADRIKGSDDE
jgi:predicted DNA-binding transcriptional regulator AlpA